MITLTIDDAELERTYYENFGGDDAKFVEFLSASCHANNVEYDRDLSQYEALYDEAEAEGEATLTHEEVFSELRKKYDIH